MIISLIHPSRGRPQKAKSAYDYWMSRAAHPENIEHILSLDFSDPTNEQYEIGADGRHESFGENSKTIIDHNDCVVEATNQAARIAKGDVLVYMSDDFVAPEGWDEKILSGMPKDRPSLLKVNDNLQPFEKDVLTIPIMNRLLYDRLGYFWNPIFRSMFVDQDLYHVCKNNNWMAFAPDLIFPHEHYSIGKADRDSTYIRSDQNWDSGKMTYMKRQMEGFPV